MNTQPETNYNFTATYSPEDNKLRLYTEHRLDSDLYNRVKEAGFKWAAKQQLFVAPMWTPGRADLLTELCGFIGDETKTLAERAAERAERFEVYQEKRANDAEQALNEHDRLKSNSGIIASTDNWRAQRKAQKKVDNIERAKQKAIAMWETSEYWESRIAGVLSHAEGRNNERTLLNRIKKLQADKRKQERYTKDAEKIISLWTDSSKWKHPEKGLTKSLAMTICNYYDHTSLCFTLEKYPRDFETYEGRQSLYSAIDKEIITPEQARELSLPNQHQKIAYAKRWINHYDNRLKYEQAILDASGYVEPEKPKRPTQPPLMNYKQPEGFKMKPRGYSKTGELETWPQVEMTKDEYKAIYKDWKYTRQIDGHRVRCALRYEPADKTKSGFSKRLQDVVVFLTDSKEHSKPEAAQS